MAMIDEQFDDTTADASVKIPPPYPNLSKMQLDGLVADARLAEEDRQFRATDPMYVYHQQVRSSVTYPANGQSCSCPRRRW